MLARLSRIVFLSLLIFIPNFLSAQSRMHDIKQKEIPAEVLKVLTEYLNILSNSESLESCANNFVKVAGGGLVNEDGESLRNSVKPYSLKKDFQNIKFYAQPFKITRINSNPSPRSSGYGASAIRGRMYKIWIAKANGQAGMPAPISILVPEGHSFVKSPKVVGIGSL